MLGGNLMDDGYHTVLTHGGSQEGYKTKFYVDREKKLESWFLLLVMIGKRVVLIGGLMCLKMKYINLLEETT